MKRWKICTRLTECGLVWTVHYWHRPTRTYRILQNFETGAEALAAFAGGPQ